MAIAKNPLQYEPKQLDRLYKPTSIISPTQTAISKHLNLSTRGAGMAHAAAVDIDKLHSPLTQNTIDIFHQSGSPWNQFKTSNNALNNLGNQTSAMLDSYKTNFNRSLYAPLSSLKSKECNLFQGKPDLLLQEIATVYDELKRRYIPSNCCLQICIRFQNNSRDFAAKETSYTDFNTIGRIMRDCIDTFDVNFACYCYKRYEILMDNEQFQIFEAKCNNTIPDCSFLHPLCKIYNTTQNILPNKELNAKTPGLITVAFLKLRDCIRVDLLLSDGGQLFGKRIFKQDLTNTISALFQNSQLSERTQSLLNKLQFVDDQIYNEYYQHLNDVCDEKEIEANPKRSSLASRLPGFVLNCANDHNRYHLNLSQLTRFFNDNNIDTHYIETHSVKEFRHLLGVSCSVSAGAATALWRYLGGFDQDSAQTMGIYTYYAKEESKTQDEDEFDPEIYYQEEEIHKLQQPEDVDVPYGSYNWQQQAIDDESLSTPWSDDEDEDEDEDDDNESDMEYDMESDNGLSLPSDWEKDEDQDEDQYIDLEYGESLSLPSEWDDDDEPNIHTFKQPSYPELEFGGLTFMNNYNASLFSQEAMANFLIIRYLLFYERFLSEFYPSPK